MTSQESLVSRSILFDADPGALDGVQEPDCFGDLHLDQIVAGVTSGREEYDLAPFFHRPLHRVEEISYRHSVLRDLELPGVLEAVREFAAGMHRMREHLKLIEKLHYPRQKQRWHVDAVGSYCDTVRAFADHLSGVNLRSEGFSRWRDYLIGYIDSREFASLVADTKQQRDALGAITYAVHISGNRVRVSRFDQERDMSAEVEQTFAKFKRGAAKDYRVRFGEHAEMNHVEAQILDRVTMLYPDTFASLDAYCERHRHYLDETVGRFDREVQFYLAYLDFIEPLKATGLTFTSPRVSARSKQEHVVQTFDLALARNLLGDGTSVVRNDFHLDGPERVLVVSGPNNGGKTTFARTFGQLHYLASLGLPVPGSEVRLFLADRIFTHFEREEDIETLRGKFEDELFRIHSILERASEGSVLIMNESFGSTTLRDALIVGTEVMQQIIELDALCVFVTFVDELASLGESTVSMMSTVVPDDPAIRTFKVVRKPADGLAYAAAIAQKYGLTREMLKGRLAR